MTVSMFSTLFLSYFLVKIELIAKKARLLTHSKYDVILDTRGIV